MAIGAKSPSLCHNFFECPVLSTRNKSKRSTGPGTPPLMETRITCCHSFATPLLPWDSHRIRGDEIQSPPARIERMNLSVDSAHTEYRVATWTNMI